MRPQRESARTHRGGASIREARERRAASGCGGGQENGNSRAPPVLFRLHRSEKRCKKEKRAYGKLTDQARELVELVELVELLASKYVLHGQHSKAAQGTTLPWYTQKEAVTF